MEIKKLSWLHREQYDSLPINYRDLKRQFNDSHTELKRKNKRYLKIKDEINELKNELRILSKQHNKLYNKLEFINKSYTLKSYLQSYSKNGKGEYLQIIVKYLNISLKNPTEFLSKTYTMGNIMEVLENENDS